MFVAVHVGAGYHAPNRTDMHRQACIKACEVAYFHADAVSAVEAAVKALEVRSSYLSSSFSLSVFSRSSLDFACARSMILRR